MEQGMTTPKVDSSGGFRATPHTAPRSQHFVASPLHDIRQLIVVSYFKHKLLMKKRCLNYRLDLD
jgi:hypothetical protein